MRLKTIKDKRSDELYVRSIAKTIDLIKATDNIDNDEPFYFLGWFNHWQFFMNNKTVYTLKIDYQYDEKKYLVLENMQLAELHKMTEVGINNIKVSTVLQNINATQKLPAPKFTPKPFTEDLFSIWLKEPSEINEEVDLPYSEIINFLNSYTKETFRTDRFLFYPKADGDPNFITNIYAYDLKNDVEMKLYLPDNWEKINNRWTIIPPKRLEDIAIDADNVSDYKKRLCKKAFLELANSDNETYGIKNYWLLELVKKCVQPVDDLHEWCCHRCFCHPELFGAIWVYDFPFDDEEPSFFITDSQYLWETTKIATINFKSPTYNTKGIYKRDNVKRLGWELNEQEKIELTEFFKKPSDRADEHGGGSLYEGYKKYVKTNWQQLIFEYNHNTAGWGWGEDNFDTPPEKEADRLSEIEALSFDLPIPDYTKLR